MSAMDPDLANAIVESSKRLGIDPVDLATSISYETAGSNSPSIYGGAGGKYLGLIQFSPENQKKYGVTSSQSAAEQMPAVESYLKDRGVRPGMGLADVYSVINAGSPGRYNATDENNGGASGTVMDKVLNQMAGHRLNAQRLLGMPQVGMIGSPAPQQLAAAAPSALAPATAPAQSDNGYAQMLSQLQKIPQLMAQKQPVYAPPAPMIDTSAARRRALAAIQQQGSVVS